MGRPLAFNKEDILSKAMYVFWENGYDGTSTDDLENATGIKRGSLYNTFENKHRLYMAVLQHYSEVHMGEAIAAVTKHTSFSESLGALLDYVTAEKNFTAAYRGCLLCDAAIEHASRDEEVADFVRNSFGNLGNAIADVLRASVREISAEHAREEADRIVAIYMGLRTYIKIGHSRETVLSIAKRELEHIAKN
ncbi:TetR/AcrR family transcriptional regulator [Kordiimonas laminariae]|uniref:TetR/AcrR family transcriptional regulator n=1 Tax=Kordiimonas laminariae TaxID=2917717 RepID=UPI001FF57307|nr:TetR/AcrR family transcriptional regulator [Kordiimonas laminariae]MCK0069983.1 TetR/AcrR family transcriptional regulator [Kordiimonas laminariae]